MAKWLAAGGVAILAIVLLLWLQMQPSDPEPERPAKLDPRSDEFFNKFDDVVPNRLTRNAAKCYEGRHGQLHRNQKLSLRFKTKIVNGEVSVHDVTIKE